jgi:hypothetical protein
MPRAVLSCFGANMRLKPIVLAVAALFPLAAAANDAELKLLREELQRMKADYERRIDALEQRIQRAEAPPTAATGPVVATTPSAAAPRATGFNPEISLILQGQAKSMQDIPERTISGYWPTGHDHGGEKRGLSVDHTELAFAANIDTLFRGTARFAVVDNEIEVEEANFATLGLGGGLALKGGRYRSEIGYINVQHPHEWDFADAPLMTKALFGAEGYRQDGLQLKWVAPTELFLQFGAEIGRGDVFPGTDRNGTGPGAGAVFAKLGGDVGTSHAWQAGISYLATRAENRPAHAEDTDLAGPNEVEAQFSGRSRAWIADFVWKWAPDGNPRDRNFKFQAEYFRRSEDGTLACGSDVGSSPCVGGMALGDYQTRQSGGYLQGVWQFVPRWRVGARYDWLSPGTKHYDDATVFAALDPAGSLFSSYRPKRSSLMLDWSPSEFSRLRLQYARDTAMADITDNQVTLQYIMSLGAHGAHKF